MDVHDDLWLSLARSFAEGAPLEQIGRTAVSVATVSALTSLAEAAPDAPMPAVVFTPDVPPLDRAREALQAILAALDAAAAPGGRHVGRACKPAGFA
jgi:hypothetical protein